MAEENKQPEVSKDEQIGIHKGALSTLAKEREELMRIIGITEQLMQMHIQGLKELGVDIEAEAKKQAATAGVVAPEKTSAKIDELL